MSHQVNRILAEIDLSAVEYNLRSLYENLDPDTKLCAVVKADGYGHGAVEVSRTAEKLPFVWGFAVATLEEGIKLRVAGITKPVLILGYVKPVQYGAAILNDLSLTLFETDKVRFLQSTAAALEHRATFHVKVDTGMNRIGLKPGPEGVETVREMLKAASRGFVVARGIFTHLATADAADPSGAKEQVESFRAFVKELEKEDIRFPYVHSANSASTILFDNSGFNLCRVGISLYGLHPSEDADFSRVPVKPVMSWYSEVTYVKSIPAGEKVGYGASYETAEETRIATVSCGYADGYPRSLSNKGEVLIRGHRCPIIGKVCMDQLMVNVTPYPEICEGDVVTLVGCDGDEVITMEELGDLSGRFNYELVCDINPRVPRLYL